MIHAGEINEYQNGCNGASFGGDGVLETDNILCSDIGCQYLGRSTLRASSCGNLVVPRTRRRMGDRAFSVAAPRAWNRLPTELKLLRSTVSFRRDLKTFLFDSVYGHQDTD